MSNITQVQRAAVLLLLLLPILQSQARSQSASLPLFLYSSTYDLYLAVQVFLVPINPCDE
jgi:hypothetical protein